MSTTVLSPLTVQRFTDNNGNPLSGGSLYTYAAGTSTPQTTYTDSTGVTPNTNPVVMNSRGEANVWMATGQTYKFSLFDAPGNLIWTVDQINSASLGVYVNVKDFGAKGDGSDDTAAINTANAAATALGRVLFFPNGTYVATQLTVLAYQNWVGENIETTLKLKNGTNPTEGSGAFIWSPDLNRDEASFTNFTFDGNSAGNTVGDLMTLYGCRTRIKNCKFLNAASNAVITNFNPANAERVSGIEGTYMDITIDSPQKSGWVHNGPNDSNFDGIIIIDAGKKTNNTFWGMYLTTGAGNGRFNNVHPWNRDGSTNVALSSIYVGSNGNTFTNSHIEGGTTSLTLVGGSNVFSSCAFYAPRGPTCVNVTSTSGANIISGLTGLVSASSNPNYTMMNLAGGFNTIDLSVVNANSGIFFNDSGTGNNIVTLTGYLNTYSGQFLYSGTPSTTDQINISVGGPGGGTYKYPAPFALATTPTAYTASITSSTGTFSNATVTAAFYYQIGKMVYFDVYFTITTPGTAGTFLQIGLPFAATANAIGQGSGANGGKPGTMQGSFTAGSQTFMSFNNYDGTSPCIAAGGGHLGGWYLTT